MFIYERRTFKGYRNNKYCLDPILEKYTYTVNQLRK